MPPEITSKSIILEENKLKNIITTSDVNGDLLRYELSFVSCPSVCPVLLENSGVLSNYFQEIGQLTADMNDFGIYNLRLTVYDRSGLSSYKDFKSQRNVMKITVSHSPTNPIYEQQVTITANAQVIPTVGIGEIRISGDNGNLLKLCNFNSGQLTSATCSYISTSYSRGIHRYLASVSNTNLAFGVLSTYNPQRTLPQAKLCTSDNTPSHCSYPFEVL